VSELGLKEGVKSSRGVKGYIFLRRGGGGGRGLANCFYQNLGGGKLMLPFSLLFFLVGGMMGTQNKINDVWWNYPTLLCILSNWAIFYQFLTFLHFKTFLVGKVVKV